MKIAWFCIPAHGHTNPTLDIVGEMTEAGHEIVYFSFETFKEKIENAGATFISCDGYDFDMDDKENADRVGKDIAFAVELMVNSTLALDKMITAKVKEINPDVIISDSVAYWGKMVATKFNIPYVSSTTTFAFNQYSSKYMVHGISDVFKLIFSMPKVTKQIRRLKGNGYPVKGIMDIVKNDNNTHTIVYTSKAFQPCSETFSDNYCFIGPSIRPIEKPMEKKALRTIYISMGTVVEDSNFFRNCIEALRNTDYQVIISLGQRDEPLSDLPDNIEVYDFVDQMAVLTITDVFITHCGMNSVSEALYYQVPLVMFPQTREQGAVAKRTSELGAGAILNSSNPSAIAKCVSDVIGNTKYKEATADISKSFKESGGKEKAKEFLEALL